MNLKLNNKRGFTLIELIVVMAILAILVALGAPRFLGYTKDAAVTAMKADSKIIEQAAYQYALKNNDAWPVGTAVTPDATLDAILKNALESKGVAANDLDTALTEVKALAKDLDATGIQPFIRSTKNPISDYFIIDKATGSETKYANQLEGYVFSKAALTGSDGTLYSGLFDNK